MSTQPTPLLIYQTADGRIQIAAQVQADTLWLTQQQMAQLFQTTQQNISLHLQNVYDEGELQPEATHKDFLSVRQEGSRQVSRQSRHYNLDAVLSVGYRVKSAVATRFRIWATQQLREYLSKGFLLDDERLKNPGPAGSDYFDELLARIQDIRSSERRFYQKITDIYATSIDYDPTQPQSILFFQTVQNKLHWAITGKTAAEIIHSRADKTKPHMGLTTWKGSAHGGKPRKPDVGIAKNYLNAEELAALNNLVEQYLVFAQGQAMRRVAMDMDDWIAKLHGFLSINDRDILDHAGKISREMALVHAEAQFEFFNLEHVRAVDIMESDFDRAMAALPKGSNTSLHPKKLLNTKPNTPRKK